MATPKCRHEGCHGYAVKTGRAPNGYCFNHYHDPDPLICVCTTARADNIGQCVDCWRPIVRLHPVLAEAWPHLCNQPVVRVVEMGPYSWLDHFCNSSEAS